MHPQLATIICGPIVRRTTSTSTTIWVETDGDCIIHARAWPVEGSLFERRRKKKPPNVTTNGVFTVKVGGRYYALLTLNNLAPGWLYKYALLYRPNEGVRKPTIWTGDPGASWYPFRMESLAMRRSVHPSFRTFPNAKTEMTRVAFASCRALGGGFLGKPGEKGEDVFPLFGKHLRSTEESRMMVWPHLLLLLGDQIYADNVDARVAQARLRDRGRAGKVLGSLNAPESILQWERDRVPGQTKHLLRLRVFGKDHLLEKVDIPDYAGWGSFHCLQFQDFAALYVASWTEPEVARLLANLPTFMIFDDHEIANDWNLTGGWVQQMKKAPGWLEAVTDGLIAYWMYQGWGNPIPPGTPDDRFTILYNAAMDGTDAIEKLRAWFKNRIVAGRAAYYYEIETSPPILVLDTRNDRSFVAPKQRVTGGATVHADYEDEILSETQWKWLRSRIDQTGPVIIASGVPFLQLTCADVWLLRGARSDIPFIKDYEDRSQDNADVLEYYRRDIGIDQWTAFPKSFVKLTRELFNRGPFIFLSGDVHYSYAMYGRADFPALCKMGNNPLILHAVSSALRNQWSAAELKKNDPEFCLTIVDKGTAENMRRGFETDIQARNHCDLSDNPADIMRLFLPQASDIFPGAGKTKKKWTHLNNIGILEVWKDGKTVSVSWLGASTKKGEALRELGSIRSPLGGFVR